MKKLLLPLVALLILFSCGKEDMNESLKDLISEENTQIETRNSKKRNVCHDGNIINVSINAIAAHQAHGDAVDMDQDGYFDLPNSCSPTDCDDTNPNVYPGADEICDDGIDNDCDGQVDPGCQETIFALAYTDVNTGDGAEYIEDTDVLIAKWVDGPDGSPDGVLGAGDFIVTNQYPLGIDDEGFDYSDPNSFGTFSVTNHVIVSISKDQATGTLTGTDAGGRQFTFWIKPSGSNPLGTERYMEVNGGSLTLFQDGLVPTSPDIKSANANSPSQPNTFVQAKGFPDAQGVDDAFVDIIIDPVVWN